MESGILGFGSGIPPKESRIPVTIGIRNPSSTDEEGESSTWNPEPTMWNPESKTLFDYLNTWDEIRIPSFLVLFSFVTRKRNRYKGHFMPSYRKQTDSERMYTGLDQECRSVISTQPVFQQSEIIRSIALKLSSYLN